MAATGQTFRYLGRHLINSRLRPQSELVSNVLVIPEVNSGGSDVQGKDKVQDSRIIRKVQISNVSNGFFRNSL